MISFVYPELKWLLRSSTTGLYLLSITGQSIAGWVLAQNCWDVLPAIVICSIAWGISDIQNYLCRSTILGISNIWFLCLKWCANIVSRCCLVTRISRNIYTNWRRSKATIYQGRLCSKRYLQRRVKILNVLIASKSTLPFRNCPKSVVKYSANTASCNYALIQKKIDSGE